MQIARWWTIAFHNAPSIIEESLELRWGVFSYQPPRGTEQLHADCLGVSYKLLGG